MNAPRESAGQTVCVLGLGYVGLPTAAMLAVNGLQVIGVDPRADVVESVNGGDVPIEKVGLKTVLQAAVNSGNLRARTTSEPADAFIIAVPTPIRDARPSPGAWLLRRRSSVSASRGAAEQYAFSDLLPANAQNRAVDPKDAGPLGPFRFRGQSWLDHREDGDTMAGPPSVRASFCTRASCSMLL